MSHKRKKRSHYAQMDASTLREVVRRWFVELVDDVAQGNAAQFARITKIHQPDVNRIINVKGRRSVTWGMIAKISEAPGCPTVPEILARLAYHANKVTTESIMRGETKPKLGREKLKERLISGEVQARASRAARERQRGEPPERPGPPVKPSGAKPDRQD
jgi:plasmid maintenance system antidote protein VapI